jgi:hypothetical protein
MQYCVSYIAVWCCGTSTLFVFQHPLKQCGSLCSCFRLELPLQLLVSPETVADIALLVIVNRRSSGLKALRAFVLLLGIRPALKEMRLRFLRLSGYAAIWLHAPIWLCAYLSICLSGCAGDAACWRKPPSPSKPKQQKAAQKTPPLQKTPPPPESRKWP